MRLPLLALVCVTLLLPGFSIASADERGLASRASGTRVEILVDGRVVPQYPSGERAYVEARKGSEYSVRMVNDTPNRVAVALAVDGLNSIDAKRSSARGASKWVLDPWESHTVEGWQVGLDHARRFVFTTEEQSYGAWLGETRNLGVISAVFFRERRPTPCCDDEITGGGSRSSLDVPARERRSGSAPNRAGARSDRAEAEAAPLSADSSSRSSDRKRRTQPPRPAPSSEHAATGSGDRIRNPVQWVAFDLDPRPMKTVDLRYAFRDELVDLGVLPNRVRVLERRERASGFAPDPGSSCCR